MTDALRCIDVTKVFDRGDRGVFDIALRVPEGSSCAMVGPNGSGKTTIINLCLGYLEPDAGRIEIKGIDVATARHGIRNAIAYVPEIARLYPHLTALEHFVFFDRLLGRRNNQASHEAVLELLRLPSTAAAAPVRTYSKGMRQKVAIALGLLKGADVFLMDEPTSGLDPQSSSEFADIVRRLRAEGKAILLSTHDLARIEDVADRVYVLDNGRLVAERESGAVAHQPRRYETNG